MSLCCPYVLKGWLNIRTLAIVLPSLLHRKGLCALSDSESSGAQMRFLREKRFVRVIAVISLIFVFALRFYLDATSRTRTEIRMCHVVPPRKDSCFTLMPFVYCLGLYEQLSSRGTKRSSFVNSPRDTDKIPWIAGCTLLIQEVWSMARMACLF